MSNKQQFFLSILYIFLTSFTGVFTSMTYFYTTFSGPHTSIGSAFVIIDELFVIIFAILVFLSRNYLYNFTFYPKINGTILPSILLVFLTLCIYEYLSEHVSFYFRIISNGILSEMLPALMVPIVILLTILLFIKLCKFYFNKYIYHTDRASILLVLTISMGILSILSNFLSLLNLHSVSFLNISFLLTGGIRNIAQIIYVIPLFLVLRALKEVIIIGTFPMINELITQDSKVKLNFIRVTITFINIIISWIIIGIFDEYLNSEDCRTFFDDRRYECRKNQWKDLGYIFNKVLMIDSTLCIICVFIAYLLTKYNKLTTTLVQR